MFVEVGQKKAIRLLNGRAKSGNTAWIPSIEEFNRSTLWMNDVALYQGCPFAAEHMYDIESSVEAVMAHVKRVHDDLCVKNRDVLIKCSPNDELKLSLDPFSRLTRIFVEAICRYGLVVEEFHRAVSAGVVGYGEANRVQNAIENKVRSLKVRPFRYNDRSITGPEHLGTIEWQESVKELGREPGTGPYVSRYFVNEKKKQTVVNRSAML